MFEITYFYHERIDGKYNTDEKKELKKKLGNAFEELPLENLAASIISQLARRDIWITDVDVYEYTKKKISFKEATDGSGILLKNKKFSFDSNSVVSQEEEPSTALVPMHQHEVVSHNGIQPHNLIHKPLPTNEMANRASNLGRVKTWVIFDPEIPLLAESKQKGLRFTVGKKYPVYVMAEHPQGLNYGNILTTVDDSGKQITVSDKYFIPANISLVGDREVPGGFGSAKGRSNGEPVLSFQNQVEDEIPVLRPSR